MRNIAKVLGILSVIAAFLVLSIPPFLYYYYRQRVYVSVEAVPEDPQTVMVLGAAVYPNDTPSSALQDRLNMAVSLYKEKNVSRILVSGARDSDSYDEPRAMKAELVKAGVPEEIILEDNLGLRTYDSCRRAKTEFGITSLLVVSQGFHLPRALFLCGSVGIDVTGIYATGLFSSYHSDWYNLREIAAMYLAVWDVVKFRAE